MSDLDDRTVVVGWTGGQTFSYEEDAVYPDDGEALRAFRGNQMRLDEEPTEDTDVVRKIDLDTLAPDLREEYFLVTQASAALVNSTVLTAEWPLEIAGGEVSSAGSSVTTYTFCTGVRWNGETLQYAHRTLTFTHGILTAISSESWSNVPTV